MLRVIKESNNITSDQLNDRHFIVFEMPHTNDMGVIIKTTQFGYEARSNTMTGSINCTRSLEDMIGYLINTGRKVYCLNYAKHWDKVPVLLKNPETITVAHLARKFDDYNTFFKKRNKLYGMIRKINDIYYAVTNTYGISSNTDLEYVIDYLQSENYDVVAERVIQ